MQVAGVSNHPAICSNLVRCCMLVYRHKLWWMTAAISCLKEIKRIFFDGKDVWWCLSQYIPGILHETDTNHQVMMCGLHYNSKCSDNPKADFVLFKLMKCTNLDIKDTAYLHVVHILQHPTSHPTTKSTRHAMVNDPKKNFPPLPAGKYGKSTNRSTRQHHQANHSKSSLEADRVRALGALRRLQSKQKLSADRRRATNFLSQEENE